MRRAAKIFVSLAALLALPDLAAAGAPPVVTEHSIRLDGRELDYTATAGLLEIGDEPAAKAGLFYVAYTKKPKEGEVRPLTFLFNGGPGSASLWLHLGSLGPMRLALDDPATSRLSYRLEPNEATLLDRSDLVFIDAVDTGYSRMAEGAKADYYHSVDSDLDSFAWAIRRYVAETNRWTSPKFLFGESYGATRAAALLLKLQAEGLRFDGAVLLSSILDFPRYHPGVDAGFVGFLPSFAAVARYQQSGGQPGDLTAYLAEVRDFARGDYASALAKGDALPDDERHAVAARLSSYIGLPADELERASLRIDPDAFAKGLLRRQGRIISRIDGRVAASDADPAGDAPSFDPADSALSGTFLAALMPYLSGDLGYGSALDYTATVDGLDRHWNWGHRGLDGEPQASADVLPDLAAAMRADPALKILSMNGWYDLVTPFFATETDLHHMLLPPDLRANLSFAYYPAGHLAYTNPEALRKMRADLGRFYDQAVAR